MERRLGPDSGQRGDAAQSAVRQMLRDFLPASIGITIGEVVDSSGNVSGQADVIIYNANRAPMS